MLKRIISISLLITTMFIFITTTASAHQIISGKIWSKYNYSSSLMHNVINMKVNGDYLNSYWSYATNARSNWNNNSNQYVNATSSAFSSSDVDLATYAVNQVPSWFSNTTYAMTYVKSGNTWVINPSTGASNNNVGNFTYAQIYTNPYYDGSTSAKTLTALVRRKVLTHEIGHVMNLAHPPTSATYTSVMLQGILSYEVPQTHDKNDLKSYY